MKTRIRLLIDMSDAGRPTKYKEEYCDELISHMERGLSYESFAGYIGVSKQTIYDWEKANPEFLDAKKIAFEKCRLFWEELGIDNIISQSSSSKDFGSESKSLNSTVWIFNMKNRFPEEWRDKVIQEKTGPNGAPLDNKITVQFVGVPNQDSEPENNNQKQDEV
jgi:DNA-binding XRE family transcriptional regulator